MPEGIFNIPVGNGIMEQINQIEPFHLDERFIDEIRNFRGRWDFQEVPIHIDEAEEGQGLNNIKKKQYTFSEKILKDYLNKYHHTCKGLLAFGIPDDAKQIGITEELLQQYIIKFEQDENNQ